MFYALRFTFMLKIALTGANGLVGSRIVELLKNDFTFLPLSRQDMDITDNNEVNERLHRVEFDLFLHLAAYTLVDKAESEKELAYAINVRGTQNIYEAVTKKNKKLIYVSTDFVFDGRNPPYYEDSKPNPLGIYAKTKYEGERVVIDGGMIVRISYPYRAIFDKKKDFARSLTSALRQGQKINMIKDASFTPTYIDDIAYALKHLMNNYSSEIYHLVGSQSLSPYEAGKKICQAFGFNQNLVEPVSYAKYSKGKAPRSQYSVIKSTKNTFCRMRTFEEGLSEMTKQTA